MINDKEIKGLIYLLDDPDPRVFDVVYQKLQEIGPRGIPLLELAWESSENQQSQNRIEELVHKIQYSEVLNALIKWAKDGGENLLYGAYLVSKYQYPDLLFSEIEEKIENIRKDIWIELHDKLTALEKVRIINHVLFANHKFSRNAGNFYSPRNSFINQVLETHKGNPISLAIIYSGVAQKLDIPIYGVNLPMNYVLAYHDPYYPDDPNGILFYINPYNRGLVLNRSDIDNFLNQQKLKPKLEYYIPCSNITTIERMLRNLIMSYEKIGYNDKNQEVTGLLKAVMEAKDQ